MREFSRHFRAMNTDVQAVVVAAPASEATAVAALADVQRLFAQVEATLSRFRPESELSRLNAAAGRPWRASPLLFRAVAAALAAARDTGGAFDPTVLPALERAGYDRSFELIGLQAAPARPQPVGLPPYTWRAVRLSPHRRSITLPPGCRIDLGGIGKGLAVDAAARRLSGFAGYVVDAGGDIRAAGSQPDGSPWTIGVEDPRAPERDLLVLALHDRAVATSTVAHRRWFAHGRLQHHIIDPRSGRPAAGDVLAVTCLAPTTTRAETLAKAALVLGPHLGLRLLEAQADVAGLLVLADGRLATTRSLEEVPRVA